METSCSLTNRVLVPDLDSVSTRAGFIINIFIPPPLIQYLLSEK